MSGWGLHKYAAGQYQQYSLWSNVQHAGFLHQPQLPPRHQSKIYLCWSLNVTDRRNTPPEPQYTAVKTISTQALPALQHCYILNFQDLNRGEGGWASILTLFVGAYLQSFSGHFLPYNGDFKICRVNVEG